MATTSNPQTRPGLQTTEFWVSAFTVLAAVATALIGALQGRSDSVSRAVVTVAGIVSAALTAMGYAGSRATTKAAAMAGSPESPAPGPVPETPLVT